MSSKNIVLNKPEYKKQKNIRDDDEKIEQIEKKVEKNNHMKRINLIIIASIMLTPVLLDLFSPLTNIQNVLIIGIIKISVITIFGILIFNLFLKQEKHYLNDAKNLFAWQFFIMTISKVIDVYIIILTNGNIQILETNPEYLLILKTRWILLTFTLAPTLFFFYYVYSKIWTRKLLENKRLFPNGPTTEVIEKVEKIVETTFDLSYIAITIILTIVAPNYATLKMFLPIFMLPLIILGTITFHQLHTHQRLPQLNSRMMEYAYLLYLVEQLVRAVMLTSSLIIYFETFETILWYTMGLAFYIRPKYGKT
ncbi:MAG: hypothetical protein ACTSRZ_07280 [Promethearchaeota archaeon]